MGSSMGSMGTASSPPKVTRAHLFCASLPATWKYCCTIKLALCCDIGCQEVLHCVGPEGWEVGVSGWMWVGAERGADQLTALLVAFLSAFIS